MIEKKHVRHTEVLMRWIGILLLVLFALAASTSNVSAQAACANQTRPTGELVRIDPSRGKPGDTVLIPYFVQNQYKLVNFWLFMQFDTTKLRPIPIIEDTNFFQLVLGPRFAGVSGFTDSATSAYYYTKTLQQASPPLLSRNIINILMPYPQDTLHRGDTIPTSINGDVLFYIPMVVQPGLRHLVDTAFFTLYQEPVCSYSATTGLPICSNACNGPQYVERLLVNSVIQDVQVYPNLYSGPMIFVTDTTPQAPTLTFSSSSTSIVNCVPSSITLSWSTSRADSILIERISAGVTQTLLYNSVALAGTQYNMGSPTVTTKFRITANRGTLVKKDSLTVSVTGSCTTVGNPPVISTSSTAFTVKEAETVSFPVTATDIDAGNTITLTASSLPTNATFGPTNPRVGTSPVSGDFSFTPTIGQKGSYSIVFTATDNTGNTTQRVVTIVVEALQFDRLFSTSAVGQSPVGGLRGTPGIRFPVNMISAQTVYGIQFDMAYPRSDIRIDSIKPTSRIPDFAVYDNLGATPGTIRVVTFGLNNEQVKSDTTTAVLYLYCTIDSGATPWTNAQMRMSGGRESVSPDPNKPSLPLVTDSGIIQVDNPGDVNLDQIIDVGDVVNIVAYIIGNYPLTARQFATADIILNDSINVFDLVGDINLIYGLPVSPTPVPPAPELATVALDYSSMYGGQSGLMTVHSELPTEIAGVQLEVNYDPNTVVLGKPTVTSAYHNFILQYRNDGDGRLKVLLYHGAGGAANSSDLIQQGAADLVNIPISARSTLTSGNKAQLRLSQALLSTPGAASVAVKGIDPLLPTSFTLKQNYPNPFNPTTKIQFSVSGMQGASLKDVTLEIFNVLGQKVKTMMNQKMAPGEYTLEWDATTDAGTRVSSGVYLYRLRVDDQSQTKKMMFLK
jgi:hypothetical protein